MGREALCTCCWAGSSVHVKALIEPPNLILRGELQRRLPLAQLQDLRADGDELHFTFEGENVSIVLGRVVARRWAEAIATPPPSLAQKLGINAETTVHVIGKADDEQLEDALASAHHLSNRRGDVIVARVNTVPELAQALKSTANRRAQGVPIWFVYPKGRGHALSEGEVRGTALAEGMVDTKVASVSARLTALRFVKRGAAPAK